MGHSVGLFVRLLLGESVGRKVGERLEDGGSTIMVTG